MQPVEGIAKVNTNSEIGDHCKIFQSVKGKIHFKIKMILFSLMPKKLGEITKRLVVTTLSKQTEKKKSYA